MQAGTQSVNQCKSVFKGTTEAAISKALTQKWTELINRLEKQKGTASTRQS